MKHCMACGDALPPGATVCPACGEAVRIFIGSTATPVETELLEARLHSADLPYLKQLHRGGGLLRALSGSAAPGADFFVPAARYAEAIQTLGLDAEDVRTPSAETDVQAPVRGGWKTRVLGLLIVAALLTLYLGLDALLSFIRHLFGAP